MRAELSPETGHASDAEEGCEERSESSPGNCCIWMAEFWDTLRMALMMAVVSRCPGVCCLNHRLGPPH